VSATAPDAFDSLPRISLQAYGLANEVAMTDAAASGAGSVRFYISWANIEPVNVIPTLYNWSAYDTLFSRLKSRNLVPIVTVENCPSWACVRDNGPLLDNMNDEVAQFAGALAARYGTPQYNVHFWEFWNEPDAAGGPGNLWGWGMHPDKYAQMLAAVYPAVKAADPEAAVILGGIAYDFFFNQGGPFNPDFLPGVLDNGGGNYLDGVGFHFYLNNGHGWTNVGLKADEIRALMEAHGSGSLPLICTEAGLSSSPDFGSSDERQARYIVQMYVQGAASGLRAQVWFLDRDFTSPDPMAQVFTESGLVRLDGTRKPSHTALRVFSEEVGSGAYLSRSGSDDGITGSLEGYKFAREDGTHRVSVVWSNAGTSTLIIPEAQALDMVRVVDINGQQLETSPSPEGGRQISVGPDPIYIEWGIRFLDVQSYSWEYPYVEYLAERGIISGYSDQTFRPGNSATRGQFSKMVVLGMGWPLVNPSIGHFADVSVDSTFYQYIETAFDHGIIGGYPCGGEGEPCPGSYFRPGNDITRAQISKLIVLAKGWPLLNPSAPTFTDVPAGSTFYTFIETSVAHGIVSGYNDATFRPGNNATRAQLSKMLALSLQQ
jgi:hypothetical protein